MVKYIITAAMFVTGCAGTPLHNIISGGLAERTERMHVVEQLRANNKAIEASLPRPQHTMPIPANYQSVVQQVIGSTLLDPYSAHFDGWTVTHTTKTLTRAPTNQYADCLTASGLIYIRPGMDPDSHYNVCKPSVPYKIEPTLTITVLVNAKNRFGAYVGYTSYTCRYNNNDIVPLCVDSRAVDLLP